jgi:hypothetical protein
MVLRRKLGLEISRRSPIDDDLLRKILCMNSALSAEDIPNDLVSLKRAEIYAKRELNKHKQTKQ